MSAMTLLLTLVVSVAIASPAYKELYYNQTLDHFAQSGVERRWPQRYLLDDSHWGTSGKPARCGCQGPILLYTGNEGPIDAFWEGNGFMIDVLAPKFGALLLFVEERYYGKSLPFGAESFMADNIKYLSTEQVIEDLAEIVTHLKSTLDGAHGCPVVAFGGSYGGTLTTFLRASKPDIVIGGLAASAPIGYYDKEGWAAHNVTEFTWSDIVNRDYDEADPRCLEAIHAASEAITSSPISVVAKEFNVCSPEALGPNSPDELFAYALESLPQLDYPYPVGGRPAWPVNATCDILVQAMDANGSALISAAATVTRFSLGISGKACVPTLPEGPGGIPGDGPGPGSWGWQSCTENLHQFSARGIRSYTFSLEDSAGKPCAQLFNDTANLNTTRLTQMYGGYKLGDGLAGISNIIWSNGALDPWSGGGFLTPRENAKGNYWIHLQKGAHHLDLRGPHPDDPDEVTKAREMEEDIISGWIETHFEICIE
mmetsp:Transcript_11218/g.27581  ORF Transcript_11218/g.27581 Transcript_11218/m.27581 type:complete len:484 (-) Transcript_11218:288-1739(-)